MKIQTYQPATDGWVHVDRDGRMWKTPLQCEPVLDWDGCSKECAIWAVDNIPITDVVFGVGCISDMYLLNWTKCKWQVRAGEIFGIKVTNGKAEIVRFGTAPTLPQTDDTGLQHDRDC